MYPPETDAGGQPPFKYPFALAHKRIEAGGWTRQVTVRDFPLSKKMAGVEMRLISGGVRELHWHLSSEWAYMTAGSARITAVDQKGRAFVDDVKEGDLWLFPGGVPHSIQGLGENGCQFLLVFNDGNFNEFETFLLTDWLHHTPKEVLAKNFNAPESTFDNVPPRERFIFPTRLPRPLAEEKKTGVRGQRSGTEYVCLLHRQDAAHQSDGGRQREGRRPQQLPGHGHRSGDRNGAAGRNAGAALAPERG